MWWISLRAKENTTFRNNSATNDIFMCNYVWCSMCREQFKQATIYSSYMCQIKGEDHSLSLALFRALAFDGTNSKFCSRFTFLMDGNFDADNSKEMKRKEWNRESYLLRTKWTECREKIPHTASHDRIKSAIGKEGSKWKTHTHSEHIHKRRLLVEMTSNWIDTYYIAKL